MNSVHKKQKFTNDFGNSAKCLVWSGTPNIAFQPLLARNLSPNVYYSVNKKNRWNIEEELTSYISPYEKWAHSYSRHETFRPRDEWESGTDSFTVGRVLHKRNHNVIQVEQVCLDEPEADWIPPQKPFPKRRVFHRNHHRPTTCPAVPEKMHACSEKDTAFVVFPTSTKTKLEPLSCRHKVVATSRGSRGRKQGRHIKHAWQSTKLIRELRNDTEEEEVEREMHTDEEYDEALRVFTRKVERDQWTDLEEDEDEWPVDEDDDDGFPSFEDWPDTPTSGYETEEFQTLTKEIQPDASCTSLATKSNDDYSLQQKDILAQFEYLLCHNKTTLEYLQNAIERAQELALWKYLESLTIPYDNGKFSASSTEGAKVTTYSTPSSTTYTTTWCTQAITPWTAVSDHDTVWTTNDHNSWCLDRHSAVDQWTANELHDSQPVFGKSWDLHESRPDVRFEVVPRRLARNEKINIPKQLYYLPPRATPPEHRFGREEFGFLTGASLGEMEDHLTFIRQLFNDDEKAGKKLVKCAPHGPIVTPTKPEHVNASAREESDEGLRFIRVLFDFEESKTKTPIACGSARSNCKLSGFKQNSAWNHRAQDEVLFALRLLFKEDNPNPQKTVSRSAKRKHAKRKAKRDEDNLLVDIRALFVEEKIAGKKTKAKKTASKRSSTQASPLERPHLLWTNSNSPNDHVHPGFDAKEESKSDSDWIKDAEVVENEPCWTDPEQNDPGTRKTDATGTEARVISNQTEEVQEQTEFNDNIRDEDDDKDDDSEAGEAADDWVIVDLDNEKM